MMYETRWRWRSTAAFGSDVVPLVKSSTPMSSGSTKGCSPVTGSAMAAANSPLVMTLRRRRMPPRRVDLVVVGDHEPPATRPEDPPQLLVRSSVVDRRERDAGQRGTEQGDRQRLGVQPEVADDLGAALLEVDGGPPGALEELGGASCRRHGSRERCARGRPRPPSRAAWRCSRRRPVPGPQSEAGSGLAPLTARMVSPTEMEPSPALVHRSSRPSSSSL